jgi:hypothetical protein
LHENAGVVEQHLAEFVVAGDIDDRPEGQMAQLFGKVGLQPSGKFGAEVPLLTGL